MLDLELGSRVVGRATPIGRLTALVLDPTTDEVTHVVVNADDVPGSERLVPIALVEEHDAAQIRLAITRDDFFDLPMFETSRFLRHDDAWHLPFDIRDQAMTFAPHERIPASDVALRRGTRVLDRDGHLVGRVHTFLVDPDSRDVTHLTLQHGHAFGARDVTIPVRDIASVTEEAIHVGLSRTQILTQDEASTDA